MTAVAATPNDIESLIADIDENIAQTQRMVMRLNAYTDHLRKLATSDDEPGDVEPHG
jgi:hypothetical protein